MTQEQDKIALTYEHQLDAAHRLLEHKGKCHSIHGHRYLIQFEVEGTVDEETGLILDFNVLKQEFGQWLDHNWDHALIYNWRDADLIGAISFLGSDLRRYEFTMGEPTAENMAAFLLEHLGCKLEQLYRDVFLVRVVVWETPNCCAEARREEI